MALRPTAASSRTSKTPLTPKLASSPGRFAPEEPLSPLSSNVTPRSAARSARAGSSRSTPAGTPDPTVGPRLRKAGCGSNGMHNGAGLAAPISDRIPRPKSAMGTTGKDPSAMFFHASEVKRHGPASTAIRSKKPTSFFYANEPHEGDGCASAGLVGRSLASSSSSPSPTPGKKRPPKMDSRFFHANAIPADRGARSPVHSPPIPYTGLDPHAHAHPFARVNSPPASPTKDEVPLPYRNSPSRIARPLEHTRMPPTVCASDSKDTTLGHRRMRSTEPTGPGHRPTSSVSSLESFSSNLKISAVADRCQRVLQADKPLPSTAMSASTPNLIDERDELVCASQPPRSLAQGPAVPDLNAREEELDQKSQTALQKMNELAANARRERKVLDLEISNSSLLAINRQLEREIRKQRAELKRSWRLTRASQRASLGTDGSLCLESFAEGQTADVDNDGDHGDDEPDEADELSSNASSADERSVSPGAMVEHDAKYRYRDQKRLRLDLAKHKELLLDSQRLDQSLRRCLTVTDDLIAEGQKALERRVRVSSGTPGGRILSPDDQGLSDDDDDRPHAGLLLSPWTQPDATVMARAAVEMPKTDRDSAIDMQAPNPPHCIDGDSSGGGGGND